MPEVLKARERKCLAGAPTPVLRCSPCQKCRPISASCVPSTRGGTRERLCETGNPAAGTARSPRPAALRSPCWHLSKACCGNNGMDCAQRHAPTAGKKKRGCPCSQRRHRPAHLARRLAAPSPSIPRAPHPPAKPPTPTASTSWLGSKQARCLQPAAAAACEHRMPAWRGK